MFVETGSCVENGTVDDTKRTHVYSDSDFVLSSAAAGNGGNSDVLQVPASGVRVLLLAADPGGGADVQSTLLGTGAFTAVDVLDNIYFTPSLSYLQGYSVVLVWTHPYLSFPSASDLGDVLAQYWDSGGAVVVATGALDSGKLQGRFGTASNGYMLIDGSVGVQDEMAYDVVINSLGTVLEPQSPLMTDVSVFSEYFDYKSAGAVINGGVVVARWISRSGRPLIVRGSRAGRPLVALNMYPVSSRYSSFFWNGDGAALMRNALLYSLTPLTGELYFFIWLSLIALRIQSVRSDSGLMARMFQVAQWAHP